MKDKILYTRKNSTIFSNEGKETFPSINAAKRKSRSIQLSQDNDLGRGSVRVVK